MASAQNDDNLTYTGDINTAPDKYSVKTGIYSSVGKICTGNAATLFTTELAERGWLFNGSNEVRQIERIVSDNVLYLLSAFILEVCSEMQKPVPIMLLELLMLADQMPMQLQERSSSITLKLLSARPP